MSRRLLGIFNENYRGFIRQYRWFIAIFVVAILCDAASTIHFMLRIGPDSEMHIIIRYLSKLLGPVAGPLAGAIGKVSAGTIVAIYLRRFAIYIFVTASVISFWAAWYNMWGHKIYVPGVLVWLTW